MLMDKKLLYESPTVDAFAVQTEGVVCQSVPGGTEQGDIIVGSWDALV